MGNKTSRRRKIEWMKNGIKQFFKEKPEGAIDKNKLLAQFALKNYSTKRTGKEILELLEDTDRIKIEGGNIYKNDKGQEARSKSYGE